MNWDHLNNNLKGELHTHQSDLNIDEIWKAIEPEVDAINAAKKGKRGGLYSLMLAGAILIGASLFFVLDSNAEPNTVAKAIVTETKEDPILAKKEIETTKSEVEKSATVKAAEISKELNNENILVTKKKRENTNPIRTNEIKTENKTNSNGISSLAKAAKKMSSPSAIDEVVATKKTSTIELPITKVENEISNSIALKDETKQTVLPKKSQRITTSILANKKITEKYLPLSLATLPMTFEDPKIMMPVVENKVDLVNGAEDFDFRKHRNEDLSYGISLVGGASIIGKQLVAKDDSGEKILPFRRQSESTLESIHFGLNLDVQHRSGFGFFTGLHRTKIAERYDYESRTSDTTLVDGIVLIRINLNGDTIKVPGLVPEITSTSFTKKVYNSYTLYDIPLLVSYHQAFNDFYVGVQAGIFLNVALSAEGTIANGENSDIIIGNETSPLFKSSVGTSFYFGGSIRKPIFENMELTFAPFVRSYSKDFSSKVNPISQKYVLFGGNVGLRYRF